jgi:2Fe-2S ferredoxin
MPKMTFIERDGTRREVDAPLGLSVLEIAHKHGVDIEGACEGSLDGLTVTLPQATRNMMSG